MHKLWLVTWLAVCACGSANGPDAPTPVHFEEELGEGNPSPPPPGSGTGGIVVILCSENSWPVECGPR